jgi:transposase-like protein
MKILIDCPLCSQYMSQRGTSGTGELSFICEKCGSKFLVNRTPNPEQKQFIIKQLQEKSISGVPRLFQKRT